MIVHAINHANDAPPDDRISAVFLLALRGDNILSVRNERGWDIPGGHVEPGETCITALTREVLEEAGVTFSRAEACAFLQVAERSRAMLFFATDEFEIAPFSPGVDAIERDVIPVHLLLERYYGPRHILQQLVSNAEATIRRRL